MLEFNFKVFFNLHPYIVEVYYWVYVSVSLILRLEIFLFSGFCTLESPFLDGCCSGYTASSFFMKSSGFFLLSDVASVSFMLGFFQNVIESEMISTCRAK